MTPYIKYVDNFLPPSLAGDIESLLLDQGYLWNFSNQVVFDNSPHSFNYYFMRRIYLSSYFEQGPSVVDSYFDAIRPMLYFIDDRFKFRINHLYSISTNLFLNQNREPPHEFHRDMDVDHWVGLYYVNSCDGPTIFEDGTEIQPVANRFLLFDGSLKHRSNLPKDQVRRVNINFNMAGHFWG